MKDFVARVDVKTKNPTNGATGNSKLAGIIRSRERKKQRALTHRALQAAQWRLAFCHPTVGEMFPDPVRVRLTRIAPSTGLDPHDGLRAALKGCVDGVADWLGLENDRDPRVEWVYDQCRGRPREYAVEIRVTPKQ